MAKESVQNLGLIFWICFYLWVGHPSSKRENNLPKTSIDIMNFFLKYLLRDEGKRLLNVAPPQLCLITLSPLKTRKDVSMWQQPSGDDPAPDRLSPFPLTAMPPIPGGWHGWHKILSTGRSCVCWDAHQAVGPAPSLLLFWKAGVIKPGFLCTIVPPWCSWHVDHPCSSDRMIK